MTGWLQLSEEQRRTTLAEAEANSGITAKAIEKDWWVTLTLKALFTSALKDHLTFKGGTSLSKCWKVISRFSEDIDLALAPEAFNMNYEETPSRSYVKRLKRAGCKFTSEILRTELEKRLTAMGIPQNMVDVVAEDVRQDMPDTDPQVILVRYPSLYNPIHYIADEVKIEVTVRSLKTPFTRRDVQSLLNEYYPNPVYGENPFSVLAVEARKTFLEKAFLLHEEFKKPDRSKIRAQRMSRHPYDLVSMMHTSIGIEALQDYKLYDHLITHRKWYTGYSYLDYEQLGHKTISFIPPDELLDLYREDYNVMRREMIYGETKEFEQLIQDLKLLQGRFRMKMEVRKLEEVINDAKRAIPNVLEMNPNASKIKINQSYNLDPNLPIDDKNRQYAITFSNSNNEWNFDAIEILGER